MNSSDGDAYAAARWSFFSTAAMERGLDGSEERFAEYFFALYQCSPDEPAGVNDRREQLRQEMPTKVLPVGKRFVLTGEAAYQALGGCYHGLSLKALQDDVRGYAKERLEAITAAHRNSQSLPIPGDLTEGQLAHDRRLEFLTCVALRNDQVLYRGEP